MPVDLFCDISAVPDVYQEPATLSTIWYLDAHARMLMCKAPDLDAVVGNRFLALSSRSLSSSIDQSACALAWAWSLTSQ